VGPRQCLAVAWAVWTIKPTLNRNDEGPDSSGPFFVLEPQQIRALNELWNCPESIQLCEEFVTFRATVDVPARFHKLQDSRCYLWADATQAPVGRDRTDGRHLEMWGCHDAHPCVRGSPSHADPHNQMVLAQGLGHKDRSTSGIKRAVVAVARRLAVVVHCMWMDDTEFRWTKLAQAA
jgi:hypothetical protein